MLTSFSLVSMVGNEERTADRSSVALLVSMFMTLILIAFFPLSAAEQNEINPETEEKLSERQRVFFFAD